MAGTHRLIVPALLTLSLGFPAAAQQPDRATQAFTRQVDAYMVIRQRVTQQVPPLRVTSDWREIQASSDALAEALRLARVNASPGDIFVGDTGGELRRRIDAALTANGLDVADAVAGQSSRARHGSRRGTVNARFDWAHAGAMLPQIIAALPPLPDGLQYRFVNRDLVLLDCDASLIIDVLPHALRSHRGSTHAASPTASED
jgi:hypothetical protein